MIATLKAPLYASDLVTAINTKLTAASLPLLSTSYGIQRDRAMLWAAPSLPAVAVTIDQVTNSGGLSVDREVVATATFWMLVADTSEPGVLADAETYPDCLRAAVEATCAGSYNRFRWVSTDVEGQRATNDAQLPVRLQSVRFELRDYLDNEGTV